MPFRLWCLIVALPGLVIIACPQKQHACVEQSRCVFLIKHSIYICERQISYFKAKVSTYMNANNNNCAAASDKRLYVVFSLGN